MPETAGTGEGEPGIPGGVGQAHPWPFVLAAEAEATDEAVRLERRRLIRSAAATKNRTLPPSLNKRMCRYCRLIEIFVVYSTFA